MRWHFPFRFSLFAFTDASTFRNSIYPIVTISKTVIFNANEKTFRKNKIVFTFIRFILFDSFWLVVRFAYLVVLGMSMIALCVIASHHVCLFEIKNLSVWVFYFIFSCSHSHTLRTQIKQENAKIYALPCKKAANTRKNVDLPFGFSFAFIPTVIVSFYHCSLFCGKSRVCASATVACIRRHFQWT